uniref:Uncharacterized protein n=1 Tax=Rhizophora mucronata TaxID=61149 RepID=A0A2P2PJ56_RHIMU
MCQFCSKKERLIKGYLLQEIGDPKIKKKQRRKKFQETRPKSAITGSLQSSVLTNRHGEFSCERQSRVSYCKEKIYGKARLLLTGAAFS